MYTTRLCFNALRSLRLSFHLRNKRDSVFMTSETAPLPSRPFNHLSVLAYLAIGIVVFASAVVAGYLIHSCYRSASRKDATRDALGKSPTIGDAESGMVYHPATGRRDWGALELNPLAREFDEDSFQSDSRTVIGKRSDLSLDNRTFVDSLQLAYYSSDAVASPSCCMSSPSPAQQKQTRFPEPLSYSPVSPSPSFFCGGSPLPVLLPYNERDGYAGHQTTSITSNTKKNKLRRAPRSSTRFDSNNIRYIPQLEPCVAESTVKLYKEPKLSPIHGSIFPPSPGHIPLCPRHNRGRQSSFSQNVPSSINSTPISIPQRRFRVISGETTSEAIVLPQLPGLHHTENMNPISSQRIDQLQHSGDPMLPIVIHLKPGPGYF